MWPDFSNLREIVKEIKIKLSVMVWEKIMTTTADRADMRDKRIKKSACPAYPRD